MGIQESLRELQKKEKLNVKREVKKELTKIKRETKKGKKCIICGGDSKYSMKGTNDAYCKDCALEHFSDLGYLKKI